MSTVRIGCHEVRLPINQNYNNLRKKLDIGIQDFIKKKNKTMVNLAKCEITACSHDAFCPLTMS